MPTVLAAVVACSFVASFLTYLAFRIDEIDERLRPGKIVLLVVAFWMALMAIAVSLQDSQSLSYTSALTGAYTTLLWLGYGIVAAFLVFIAFKIVGYFRNQGFA